MPKDVSHQYIHTWILDILKLPANSSSSFYSIPNCP